MIMRPHNLHDDLPNTEPIHAILYQCKARYYKAMLRRSQEPPKAPRPQENMRESDRDRLRPLSATSSRLSERLLRSRGSTLIGVTSCVHTSVGLGLLLSGRRGSWGLLTEKSR